MTDDNPNEQPSVGRSTMRQNQQTTFTILERSIFGAAFPMVAVFAYTVVVRVPIGVAIFAPMAAFFAAALAICVVNLIARAMKWMLKMRHARIESSRD